MKVQLDPKKNAELEVYEHDDFDLLA